MNKCGNCQEFMSTAKRCGHPMVYLNHEDNEHKTTASTPACGFYRKDPDAKEPRIIHMGKKELDSLNYRDVESFVHCSFHSSVDHVLKVSNDEAKSVCAYDLVNYRPLSETEDLYIEVYNLVKNATKDIVFHDDFGKYRARELSTAIAVFLNRPIHFSHEGEIRERSWDIAGNTGIDTHGARLARLLSEGKISLPEDFKPLMVIVANTSNWRDNYSIEALEEDYTTTFLMAGYSTIEAAHADAKQWNMEVAFHSVVPELN